MGSLEPKARISRGNYHHHIQSPQTLLEKERKEKAKQKKGRRRRKAKGFRTHKLFRYK